MGDVSTANDGRDSPFSHRQESACTANVTLRPESPARRITPAIRAGAPGLPLVVGGAAGITQRRRVSVARSTLLAVYEDARAVTADDDGRVERAGLVAGRAADRVPITGKQGRSSSSSLRLRSSFCADLPANDDLTAAQWILARKELRPIINPW